MGDTDFRTLLGHHLLRALLPALLAIALIVPAAARAGAPSGGASPDVASKGRTALTTARRSAIEARHPAAFRIAHRRPLKAAVARLPSAAPQPEAAPGGAPIAAPALRRPDPSPVSPTRIVKRGDGHHGASYLAVARRPAHPGARVGSARPVVRHVIAPQVAVRPQVPWAAATASADVGRAAPAHIPVRRPFRVRAPAAEHRVVVPKRERVSGAAVIAAHPALSVSPPVSGSVPPSGAEGPATGGGSVAAGATAAAVLTLAGLALLGALLPGLLGLDVLPSRSAVFHLRLERPG